jgi:hypothetical protein
MPQTDPEKRREYMRAYYQANKDRWAAQQTEERREYNREYMRQHPDRKRAPVDKQRRNARKRDRYQVDPAYRAECNRLAREGHARNPQRALLTKYKLTATELEIMEDMGCNICGASFEHADVRRVIDHDHKTGATRGVLCAGCNLALGHIKDDPIVAQKMVQYLLTGGVYAPRP